MFRFLARLVVVGGSLCDGHLCSPTRPNFDMTQVFQGNSQAAGLFSM